MLASCLLPACFLLALRRCQPRARPPITRFGDGNLYRISLEIEERFGMLVHSVTLNPTQKANEIGDRKDVRKPWLGDHIERMSESLEDRKDIMKPLAPASRVSRPGMVG
jgi:hypothetical protein